MPQSDIGQAVAVLVGSAYRELYEKAVAQLLNHLQVEQIPEGLYLDTWIEQRDGKYFLKGRWKWKEAPHPQFS